MHRITFTLVVGLLLAGEAARSQLVTISGKGLRLEQVFSEIIRQANYEFFYQSSLLKNTRRVTLEVQLVPVQEVLERSLRGQGLDFTIRNRAIIIFKKDDTLQRVPPTGEEATPPVKTVIIRGKVMDTQGQPVEMASVLLLRTRSGTQTDRDGYFTLSIAALQTMDSLDVSFIGLQGKRLSVAGTTDMGVITLAPADNKLDETIVVAYGVTSDRFRTGDIATVKANDIVKVPVFNVMESLAGRIAGVNVWQNGSFPNSVYNIQLRGVSIIPPESRLVSDDLMNYLSRPLFVLDGHPLAAGVASITGSNRGMDNISAVAGAGGGHDPLYWINPYDVESISILKDAEATALYGSRAANGVVMIATRKGKPGRPSLTITANTGVNMQAKRLRLMNTPQYLAMRKEAWRNTMHAGHGVTDVAGTSFQPTVLNSFDLLLWDSTRYTDWQRELLGSAPTFNAHAELSGGGKLSSYRLGAGYNNARTPHPPPPGKAPFREERSTLSGQLSWRSRNNRFRVDMTARGAIAYSRQPIYDVYNYIFLAPNAPAMLDAAGQVNTAAWHTGANGKSLLTGNPLELMAHSFQANRLDWQVGTQLSYEVLKALSLSVNLSYARGEGDQLAQIPRTSDDPGSDLSVRATTFVDLASRNLSLEPGLRYETRWGRHHLVVQTGGSFQADKQESHKATGRGYTSDEQLGGRDGATSFAYGSYIVERRSIAAWGRASYRYAGKYLVDGSVRRDGSSSFGPGRRFGNFGSAGLGWIFTEEQWGKRIPLLTMGKLRGSYGITGSQHANPYAYYATFIPAQGVYRVILPNFVTGYNTNGGYDNIPTLQLSRPANATLGWARAKTTNLAIDLYFLPEQRLRWTVQWYRKITGDQLVVTPISKVAGLNEYFLDNAAAEVENKGIEAMVDYRSRHRPYGFTWEVHFNIAANRNKLLSYPGLENMSTLNYYIKTGEPLMRQELWSSFWISQMGIYQLTDSAHPAAVSRHVDKNPDFTGGIQAAITWKGFTLSMSGVFAKQPGFSNLQGTVLPGSLGKTAIGNQPASIAAKFYAGASNNNLTMDVYWNDASYFLLKNAALSYGLPGGWWRKFRMKGATVYINAENLLLFSLADYRGANPEQAGLTTTQVPLRRILVAGFTINL